MEKEKILIVDDSEMNRSILADMLGENYDIIEAKDGVQALEVLQDMYAEIDLVLLDVVMPKMDGFELLEVMNQKRWIDDIPVIMVSAESKSSQVEQAYELGATDFIMRPFDTLIVRHRVLNTMLLYAKQRQLISMVEEQLYEKQKISNTMIDILSHIVEVRNGESGRHVLYIRAITDFLLRKLKLLTDKYNLTSDYIGLISNASALHDIGKISIDEKILNKPGKLTAEEYEIMKSHTVLGTKMLEGKTLSRDNLLVSTAYEICRWHHERYDGNGYPDGLKGDDIPISAQVVAVADVYDALTSARAYKAPLDHDTAVQMILNGECGAFNPLLLECLRKFSDELKMKLEGDVAGEISRREIKSVTEAALNNQNGGASERTLRLLDYERIKKDSFLEMSEEIQFEYSKSTHTIKLSSLGAKKLGLNEVISDLQNDTAFRQVIKGIELSKFIQFLKQATPEKSESHFDCMLNCDGEPRWHRVVVRAVRTNDDPPQCDIVLGKAVDIHEIRNKIRELKHSADVDSLTGLLNFASSKREIEKRLSEETNQNYMMAVIDIDNFKNFNDTYGHQTGNEILHHIASVLKRGLRSDDISSRIGGDEFLIFLKSSDSEERAVKRIFKSLSAPYKDYSISVSMGISKTADVGTDYDAMFRAADQALYFAKENGRGSYHFYDDSIHNTLLPSYESKIFNKE